MATELSDFWQEIILRRRQAPAVQRLENADTCRTDPIVVTRSRIQRLESELAELREHLHTLTGDRT